MIHIEKVYKSSTFCDGCKSFTNTKTIYVHNNLKETEFNLCKDCLEKLIKDIIVDF